MKKLNFKKLISPLVPLGAILIIISSCYPNNGTVYPSSLDTVLTLYDESVDFNQYKTYALPDSIADVGDPDDNDYVELTDKFDEDILNKVKSNLDALGYTQELDPETNGADVFVFVSKVEFVLDLTSLRDLDNCLNDFRSVVTDFDIVPWM